MHSRDSRPIESPVNIIMIISAIKIILLGLLEDGKIIYFNFPTTSYINCKLNSCVIFPLC